MLLINCVNSNYVLFWNSAPRSFSRLLSREETPIWCEKRSTLWPENEFFKMDALTVLSIWDINFDETLHAYNVHSKG